jgi:hypothetical protein
MKKTLLTAIILSVMLLFTLPVFAELAVYTFSQTTATYAEITGGLSLGSATTDNQRFVDPAVPLGITAAPYTGPGLPIGFNFTFNDYVFDVIAINANGWISFGQSSLGAAAVDITSSNNYTPISATNTITPSQLFNRVAGFGRDIQAQTGATLRMETIGTAPNRACIIQWKNYKRYGVNGNGDILNFQIQLFETINRVAYVYGPITHGATATTAYPQVGMRGPSTTDFLNRTTTTDWTATTAGTASSETCLFSATVIPPEGLTFEYTPPAAVSDDMQAISIIGNLIPIQGTPTVYTITVRNAGSTPESDYTVKLMAGTTELASVAGTLIQPDEMLQIPVTHTFTTTGPLAVYGLVDFTGDMNLDNNDTALLNLIVQPAGVIDWDIGAGNEQARMPMDFYWKNSLYECLYLSSEVYLSGQITGVSFFNNFVSTTALVKPTKIWIGETTQNDLSAAWIPSTQLTSVFDGNLDYPFGQNLITIIFPTPYQYNGGNLVVMVQRPMDTLYYNNADNFYCQTIGTARSRKLYSDTVAFDPTNPAAATPTGQFPKIKLHVLTENMGSVSGIVSSGGSPLSGATVALVGTQLTVTSGADGSYSFPLVYTGQRQITASKTGYVTQTQTVAVVENQNSVLNFDLILIPQINVTGTILGNDAPNGLADATVALTGANNYSGTTNAQGQFTITGVWGYASYSYTITKNGYQQATGSITIEGSNYDMGSITINETAFPVTNVVATEVNPVVTVSWTGAGPIAAGWIRWDSGENNDSIGTGAVADFDIASRWPLENLADYIGQSLYAVEFWPAEANCTYSVRVWTGGSAAAPGAMVVDQIVTNPTINAFNTVVLNTPVPIPLGEELWFGVRCNTTTGYPAGVDAGPAHSGLGNMMYFDGAWSTLLDLAPTLDYDWNLAGYIGFDAPAVRSKALQPIAFNYNRVSEGTLSARGNQDRTNVFSNNRPDGTRILNGYKVWRLNAGQETNEGSWTLLTPNVITSVTFNDTGWSTLPVGNFKWAVKAIYTSDIVSPAAISNAIYHTSTDEDAEVPVITALNGNYPNPFNPETTISYSVKNSAPVAIEIYNTKGQKVRTLVNETKASGNYSVRWDGTDENGQKVTSGVYFYKMNTGKYTSSKKMILMK